MNQRALVDVKCTVQGGVSERLDLLWAKTSIFPDWQSVKRFCMLLYSDTPMSPLQHVHARWYTWNVAFRGGGDELGDLLHANASLWPSAE